MRILKKGSCPSLSGQSTLTYHIGHKDEDVYFRLVENSHPGLFSDEWLSLQQVDFKLASEVYSFTSSSLYALFMGRSINSGGFLLAVLIKEGLVSNIAGKKHRYCWSDSTAFMQEAL
jgi:hypothetical protein